MNDIWLVIFLDSFGKALSVQVQSLGHLKLCSAIRVA